MLMFFEGKVEIDYNTSQAPLTPVVKDHARFHG